MTGRTLHMTTRNQEDDRVELTWEEHCVTFLTEDEAQQLVQSLFENTFDPATWGERYRRAEVVLH